MKNLILKILLNITLLLSFVITDLPTARSEELNKDIALQPSGETDRYTRPRPWPRPYPPAIACYARDDFGRTFRAIGYNAYWTQEEALNLCRSYNYYGYCYGLGCGY